jgi:hypothetical protein
MFEIQLVLAQDGKNLGYYMMFFKGHGEDEDMIHIGCHLACMNKIS